MIGDFMFGKVTSAPISCQMCGPTVHWWYGIQISSSSQHTYACMLPCSATHSNSSSPQILNIIILEFQAAETASGGISSHAWEKHQSHLVLQVWDYDNVFIKRTNYLQWIDLWRMTDYTHQFELIWIFPSHFHYHCRRNITSLRLQHTSHIYSSFYNSLRSSLQQHIRSSQCLDYEALLQLLQRRGGWTQCVLAGYFKHWLRLPMEWLQYTWWPHPCQPPLPSPLHSPLYMKADMYYQA